MPAEDSASGSSDRKVKQHNRVDSGEDTPKSRIRERCLRCVVEANSLKRGRAESVVSSILSMKGGST